MGVMQRIWPLFAALLSGVLLALCYAPFNIPVMVWLGLVPLLASLWGGGGKRRKLYGFGAGYLSGLSFWLLNLNWLAEVGTMGWIAVSFFLALYFAFWGVFAAGVGIYTLLSLIRTAGRIYIYIYIYIYMFFLMYYNII